MENLDQWILAIIGLGAALSPTLAAYFNNKTQYKISKLNTLYSTKIGWQRYWCYIKSYWRY